MTPDETDDSHETEGDAIASTPSGPEGASAGGAAPPTEEMRRALNAGDLGTVVRLLRAAGPLYGLPGARRAGGGLTADGEFVSFYFTDRDRAREYARENDFLGRNEDAEPPRHDDPLEPLRQARDEDFAGVIVDPGSGHPLPLSANAIEALLARSEEEGADETLETGEDEAGEPREREGTARAGTPPPPPHLLELADRVRKSPTLDPVPPPDRPPAEAREVVQELRELALGDRIPVWEVVDTLAYETAFHVPVAPEPVHGLRWPLMVRHPRDPDTPSVWIFTDPDRARRSLDQLPGNVETLRLSGLEAFRWIWAIPTPVPEVVVDLHPDAPPPLFVPDTWMLGALYPHFLDCPDLRRVRRVPLAEVGGLPGARGTKLEVVRALIEPWGELSGTDSPGRSGGTTSSGADMAGGSGTGAGDGKGGDAEDAVPEPVTHRGGRYIPAHSSGSWIRAPSPPFRDWLRASSEHSGILLDPEGSAPLPLDHADLAILALWAESGAQPDGTAVAGLVADLREDVGPAASGRILADWPRWFWALQGGGEDEPTRAMTLADRDACPVFSSDDRIRAFLDQAREGGLVSGEMQPLAYLTGWAFNVFREIHVRYREGGWLDPEGPHPEEGMELDVGTVRAALARIEWRLQPRVPGFLANP